MAYLRAFNIFSPNPDLLEQFAHLSKETVEEASVLIELLCTENEVAEQVRQAQEIEHAADEIVHRILRTLSHTYVLTYDREDLQNLASSLDDVIDFAYGAADCVLLYKLSNIPPAAEKLAQVIHRQVEELEAAVSALPKPEDLFQYCDVVKQLEVEANQITSSAVTELFEDEKNAIQVIKLKDLFKQLAFATDRAKDAAEVLEGMALKDGPHKSAAYRLPFANLHLLGHSKSHP